MSLSHGAFNENLKGVTGWHWGGLLLSHLGACCPPPVVSKAFWGSPRSHAQPGLSWLSEGSEGRHVLPRSQHQQGPGVTAGVIRMPKQAPQGGRGCGASPLPAPHSRGRLLGLGVGPRGYAPRTTPYPSFILAFTHSFTHPPAPEGTTSTYHPPGG